MWVRPLQLRPTDDQAVISASLNRDMLHDAEDSASNESCRTEPALSLASFSFSGLGHKVLQVPL